MVTISIEQAIFGGAGPGDYRLLGRSSGFLDDWVVAAEMLCAGFGARPTGLPCPDALFAKPLDRRHVAIVQVADLAKDEEGRPILLGFRFLVMPQTAYRDWIASPFLAGDRFPPSWHARGDLPLLCWPPEPIVTPSV